jgi:replication-associated recombination protein RarA
MSDLFEQKPAAPLAELLRPTHLDEVVGQSHLIAPGKPLRLAFQSGKPHSIQQLTKHVRLVDCFTPIREDFLK